ncbi:nucleotidyltransferase domain-containing protein [Frondihabitans australicus]|uniref:Nucleotidyltransferase-like protein n=1 Tax=Frondihabitans australicus TaxID=386892 RepID=A0A495IEM5_9MICO|nr:nucleotidyltransferase domain-containing protein [Frondihabitans australicus]RKR73595.1 nucleotidyltransferase-like protein [Frondihabitans australicus]
MDLSAPLRTVTPTIDGDVLAVLARADDWYTVSTIRRLSGSGSGEGVRKVLKRLAHEGVVDTQPAGNSMLYRLNRDHIAAEAITDLAHLAVRLRDRMSEAVSRFQLRPTYAILFGSAARSTMTSASDLDLLFVRDGEMTDEWADDLDAFAHSVFRWSGNDPQIVEYERSTIVGAAGDEPLLESVAVDGIAIHGSLAAFRREVRPR